MSGFVGTSQDLTGPPNFFGISQYDYKTSFFGGQPVLSEGAGYGVVCGFGVIFTILTTFLVWVDHKYGGTKKSSEEFNTCGRAIKTGLTAADIVSKWTWAATLLQSSNVAWKYGVSGPFWYASGATIQILLFGILAVEVKRKAPRAHTVLEIVEARWGAAAHNVFFVFCLATNVIVTGMLLLGGASVINALTGMDIYAAAMLIPISVMVYTAFGGLKATFLASYIHTVYIYVALLIFAFKVYATYKPYLGSPGQVWENLTALAEVKPVAKNRGGSYVTMLSTNGFIFGVINVIGNFGTVFVDQAYWQSAIAAKPSASYRGYLLGGLCWFAIPFTLATSLGLAARALDLPLTLAEANSGLVPPATAVALMGNGGAWLITIMLFMAVTSAGSAELIAMSSLFTYNVWRRFIEPNASGPRLVLVSRLSIVVYAPVMGAIAIGLLKANVSLGWVYVAMGCIIGSAVPPLFFVLTWRKCTANAAIAGSVIGLVAAIITWLVWAKVEYGEVTIDTTGSDYPVLAGNLMAIVSSAIICAIVTYMKPDNYNWESTKHIAMLEEDGSDKLAETGEDSAEAMDKAIRFIVIWGVAITILILILWPLLALPATVFSKGYFTFWVIISLIWGIVASFLITLLPPWEARATIIRMTVSLLTCKEPVFADEPTYDGSYNVKPHDAAPKGAMSEVPKEVV